MEKTRNTLIQEETSRESLLK